MKAAQRAALKQGPLSLTRVIGRILPGRLVDERLVQRLSEQSFCVG